MKLIKGKRQFFFLLSLGLVVFLSGCFLSEDKALENAHEAAEKSFNGEAQETNQKIDVISLHLPDNMEINGSSNNNVFLQSENQQYLLFYNQFEGANSHYLFDGIQSREDSLMVESFEDDSRFGFIAVFPNSEKAHYELQVGIGGAKITTITTKEKLEQEAKEMMDIINSVEMSSPE
ncbi:hypothetical protein SAMN05421676_11822 [Salinibacillus kushneri]|uniref:DUF4367 domain-containing protein n=1 Tax=Salinibacillus kushneri TaxID=237682 RepID=A0A1I0JCS5_9BACI|nr:hypothetical protein [Salinibacillus kushneri]SEU07836.1 hypothetical protein SAMN05421676_11822 [Salinibacillus kushneri]